MLEGLSELMMASCRVSFNLPHVERAPPVAITNKTPAYEYYGFVMYLASFVAFGKVDVVAKHCLLLN